MLKGRSLIIALVILAARSILPIPSSPGWAGPVAPPSIQTLEWNVEAVDGIFIVTDDFLLEWLIQQGYVVRPPHWMLPFTSPYTRSQLQTKANQYSPYVPPPPPPPPDPEPEPPPVEPSWWTVEVCGETYRLNLRSSEDAYRELYRVETLYADLLFDHIGTARARSGAGQGYEWIQWGSIKPLTCASEFRTALRIEVGRRGWSPHIAPLEPEVWTPVPDGYVVVENEYLRLGFVPEAGGVLAWLSYQGGPNLIDDSAVSSKASSGKPDRGREFQGVLWEGYPPAGPTADRQLCYDVVNPTPAAGNWGNSYVTPIEFEVGSDYVRIFSKPYDYYSLRAGCRGPYRMARIGSIFPETMWWGRFTYRLEGRTVRWTAEYWHEDAEPRWLNHSNVLAMLNPAYVQRPLENEHLRIWSSWRQDRINDIRVIALAPELRLRITFYGDLGPGTTHHGHLVDWYDPYTQAEPGKANVVELGVQGTHNRWVSPHQIIRQEATLIIEEIR